MILIADSGSTKTDWCFIEGNNIAEYFKTEGYNPYYATQAYIIESIRKNMPEAIDVSSINEVHFYGAGCHADKIELMEETLYNVFHNCERIRAAGDLLAAARGLLGHREGFAAILGTGTNTGIYDGKEIVEHVDSLGFILGDEGSGAAIGKQILSDYMRNRMPETTKQLFYDTYQLTPGEILNKVYTEPLANRFCASFTRFLALPDVDKSYARELVKGSFHSFFRNLVSSYPNYSQYTFNCVGSIGYHFGDLLMEVMAIYNMEAGKIIPSLIEELANYHLMKSQK
ncbi:N-acetylglucosamine kinase [Olivibacter sitiensis]|uniref:N-acetylglucosamine kinase n=1 Tax=Olivibacter sitiensis TaxID=376470 RepID=UPI0003FACB99|nr:N-acetylglucosamine kinase [Olivibacter sitiensis]